MLEAAAGSSGVVAALANSATALQARGGVAGGVARQDAGSISANVPVHGYMYCLQTPLHVAQFRAAKPRTWVRHYEGAGSDPTHACGHQKSPAPAGLSFNGWSRSRS